MSANALRVVVYYSARKLRRSVLLSRSHYGEDAEVLGNRVTCAITLPRLRAFYIRNQTLVVVGILTRLRLHCQVRTICMQLGQL